MILSDNGNHSIYRVVLRNYRSNGVCHVDTWNVKASSPSTAVSWALTYRSYGLSCTVLTYYKLRKQPVWLKKIGHWDSRFDLRKREVFRPTPL
jgi:hypothetical protein